MKKQLTTILLVLVCYSSFAQITFEKGYYINNNNQKVECIIKNVDWMNNPSSFEYRLSENSELKTLSIKEVKEFGVYNFSKYQRKIVNMDRSSNNTNELNSDRRVKFKEEELFLKVLIEGPAILYSYQEGNLTRFFYKKENSEIQQLIYKRYFVSPTQVGKNNRYQQQLWNDLRCQKISIKDIEKVDYKLNELLDFFVEYNKCSDKGFVSSDKVRKKSETNLNLRVGVTNSSLTINQPSLRYNDDEFSVLEYRFGLELEHILPFNKNKWAVLVEPIYQTFSTTKSFPTNLGVASEYELTIDYSSIDVAIGARHYLFLNSNSKFFINALFNLHISGTVEPVYSPNAFGLEYEFKVSNFVIGAGFKHKEKYSIELRYESRDGGKNFLSESVNYKSDMLSIIFGYKIF